MVASLNGAATLKELRRTAQGLMLIPRGPGLDTILVHEVDPLRCSACPGVMRIVAFIVDTAVIYRILKHLDLLGNDPPGVSLRGPPATGIG